jgi:hypothetical protein
VTTPSHDEHEPEVEPARLWANGRTDLDLIEALAEIDPEIGKAVAYALLEVED